MRRWTSSPAPPFYLVRRESPVKLPRHHGSRSPSARPSMYWNHIYAQVSQTSQVAGLGTNICMRTHKERHSVKL